MRAVLDAPAQKPTWGGARRGAGRKKKNPAAAKGGARSRVAHRKRPAHSRHDPVHVTLRARPGLPSFRAQRVHAMLLRVLERQKKRPYAPDFQVVHYSIQSNHLHVILEAHDKRTLRSGASGLVIAFAKQLNKLLSRKTGKVWADRYHAHALRSPREVRNALVYVLTNWLKHGHTVIGGPIVDRHSSAPLFGGWTKPVIAFPDTEPWSAPDTRTWKLGSGWKRHGLLDPRERPASSGRDDADRAAQRAAAG